MFWTL
jgi:hypothetical protein